MNRTEKQQSVETLHTKFQAMSLLVLTDFTGFDVDTITGLRSELRDADAEFHVVKNRLAKLALEDTTAGPIEEWLTGPTGIAMSASDPVGAAKVLSKYAKRTDSKPLVIKGAVLDGKPLSSADVASLATMPSLDELRAKFIGLLNAPAQKFVGTIAAVPRDLVGVLTARAQSLEEG